MFTVADARRCAVDLFMQSAILKTQPRSSLTLDADVLLQHFLNKPRAWLFAHDDADISSIRKAFCAAVEQRCTGLPIAYITGEKDFWGLPFHVSPDVLIPKQFPSYIRLKLKTYEISAALPPIFLPQPSP